MAEPQPDPEFLSLAITNAGNLQNGDTDLNVLYSKNRDEIFAWLERVAQTVPDGARPEMEEISQQIKDLSLPEGELFIGESTTQPRQHAYRRERAARQVDEFRMEIIWQQANWYHVHGHGGALKVPYWGPYDLLGLFISRVAQPQRGANLRNFYLPLTAVYTRWCLEIGGTKDGNLDNRKKGESGTGPPATMFQCTWRVDDSPDPSTPRDGAFFLGTSLAGYSWAAISGDTEQDMEKWKLEWKQRRFDLLDRLYWPSIIRSFGPDEELESWALNNSPSRKRKGENGTRFGNCAETYPYINMLQ